MKKFLLILSVMCLFPLLAQAQVPECRPVSQFSLTAEYDDVTLNWSAPTSDHLRYYEGELIQENGTFSENEVFMAVRFPSSALADYPSTPEYPFTLENVSFLMPEAMQDINYQVLIYTADPNGPSSGDFSATLVATCPMADITSQVTPYGVVYVATFNGYEIDKTQDLILAVKLQGEDLVSMLYTEDGAVNGMSNLISLDGVNFDYVYESSNSLPVSWFMSAIVDYPNLDGNKGILAPQPVEGMKVYQPADFLALNYKSLPETNTVVEYVLYRDGVEIATVDGDVLSFVDEDLEHVTKTYVYGIEVVHNYFFEIECVSRRVEDEITLNFCEGDDYIVNNLTSFVNIEERAISVYWDEPNNEDVLNYTVQCFDVDNNICIEVATTEIFEYTLSGMEAGNYQFCVYANYPTCSSSSVCTGILTLPVECGYPVSSFTAQQDIVHIKSVDLEWVNPVTSHDISGYTINKYQFPDVFVDSYTASASSLNYQDMEVEFGNTYKYEIIVNYENGCYSIPVEATVAVVISPVTDLAATTNNVDEVTLTWVAPTQQILTGYNVYVDGELVNNTIDTTFTSQYPAGSYQFGVSALYGEYESEVMYINVVISGNEQYVISASANPEDGGYVAGYGTYMANQEALLTASPAQYFAFVNWTEGGVVVSENAEYEFVVEGNRNLVANFAHENILSIGNYVGFTNEVNEISVDLTNMLDEVAGFQMDIELGDLTAVAYDESGVVFAQATERTEGMTVVSNLLSNNVLRILAFYTPGAPVNVMPGTDGAIVTFQVMATENAVYPLNFASADISNIYGTILYDETVNGSLNTSPAVVITANKNIDAAGDVFGQGNYFVGETVEMSATTNYGYTFINWTENDEVVSVDPDFSFVAEVSRTFYANYSINTYVINATLNIDGAATIEGAGEYAYGTAVTLATYANPGYLFLNWTENGEVVSTSMIYEFIVDCDRELVANYTSYNTVSIADDLKGNLNEVITIGVDVENYVDDVYGFQFDIELGDLTAVPYEDETLVQLTERTEGYTVMANLIEGNVIRVVGFTMQNPLMPIAGTNGDILTFQVQTANPGVYPIELSNGFLSDNMGNILYTILDGGSLLTGDVYISAVAVPDYAGVVTGAGLYVPTDIVTLTATPNQDYAFINWTENGEEVYTESEYVFEAVEDRDLVANFAVLNTLSIGSYSTALTQEVEIAVELTNNIDLISAFQFDIPLGDLNLVEGSVALTDRVNESHNIESAIIDGNVLRVIVFSMLNQPLEGTEGAICTFEVYGDEEGSYPLVLENASLVNEQAVIVYNETVDGELLIHNNPYIITAVANPEIGGTVEGAGEYFYNENVTVTATPNEGYLFLNWTENGEIVSDEEDYTFKSERNRDLVANFEMIVIDNFLSFGHYVGAEDETITVGVAMTNTDVVSGVQFDVVLPDQVTFVEGSVALTERASENHIVVAQLLENNTLRILTYAMPLGDFSGTEGDIVTFQVTLGELEATYPVAVTNAVLSDYMGTILPVGTVDGTITIGEMPVYTVNASVNPAEGGIVVGAGEYLNGEEATLAVVLNQGYTFVNWTENGEVVSTENVYSFIVTGDRNLVANVEAESTVNNYLSFGHYAGNAGETITVGVDMSNEDVIAGFQVDVLLPEQVTFVEGSVALTDRASENHVVVAQLLENNVLRVLSYAMPLGEFSGNEGDIFTFQVTLGEEEATYPVALAGAVLSDYMGNLLPVGTVEGTITIGDMPIFTVNATVNPAEGGSVIGAGEYFIGEEATLAVVLNPGYRFVNWTEDGEVVSTENVYTFTVLENRDLVANVELIPVEQVIISAGANPVEAGYVLGAGVYMIGDEVTLTANALIGYEFVNWTENGEVVAETAEYTFTAEYNRSLVANFNTVETAEIVVTMSIEGAGIVIGDGIYNVGETVTLQAYAFAGYQFNGWKENGEFVSTDDVYTFVAEVDRNIVAEFDIYVTPSTFEPVSNLTYDTDNLSALLSWTAPTQPGVTEYIINIFHEGTRVFTLHEVDTEVLVKFHLEGNYQVRVYAVYAEGISDYVEQEIEVAVNTLTYFEVSNPILNVINLSWSAPSDTYNDFVKYQINTGTEIIEIYNINETNFVDYITEPGTYNYCITVVYGNNLFGYVETEPICKDITVTEYTLFPSVVMNNPVVVNLTADISWDVAYPSSVLYYNVYVDNAKVGSTTDMNYICKFTSEALHTISVEAIYVDGSSAPTNINVINDVNEVSALSLSQNLNEINITWTKPVDTYGDFDHYTIKRDGEVIDEVYNYNQEQYVDIVAEHNTTYNYCMIVTYTNGDAVVVSQPECKSIHVSEVFPSVPYIIVDSDNNYFVATWPEMPNAVSYTVYYDGVEQVTAETLFAAKDVPVGMNVIGVVVNYANGSSAITNAEFNIYLNPVVNLAAEVEGADVTLTWEAPSDIYNMLKGYQILRNGVEIATVSVSSLSYTDTPEYGIYEYCVKAQYGLDVYSAGECVSGIAPECPMVNDLFGTINYSDGAVVLSWSAPNDYQAYSYIVYRNNVRIATVEETTYSDMTISDYNEYVYNIAVVCYDGFQSELSAPYTASFACGDAPVRNLNAVFEYVEGVPTVTVSWDKPLSYINGQVYNIYRQGELIAENHPSTVYYDNTNMPSGTYTYTVTEVCPNGGESLPAVVPVAVETGIGDVTMTDVNVYPNPTAGDVTVSGENIAAIVVYNSVGQIVRNITVDGSEIVTVSTAGLSNGVYIFNILNVDGMAIQKRVVVNK